MVLECSTQVAVGKQMETARPTAGAPAIYHHHHEAEFRDRLETKHAGKCLGHEEPLRPGVHLLNNRVLAGRIKARRAPDEPVKIRGAIGSLALKRLRNLPAKIFEGAYVRLFEDPKERAIRAPTQDRLCR